MIAACMVNACAFAARAAPSLNVQSLLQPCIAELAAPELDAIRSKADVARKGDDAPPPFRIVLNDAFASDTDRPAIARWLRLQNWCGRHMTAPDVMPLTPDASLEPLALQQAGALARALQASIRRLTRALYFQQLTYGEFTRKKYDFTRDATALVSALAEAGRDPDQTKLEAALRNCAYVRMSWNVYLWRLNVRQARQVHLKGTTFT
jgi:hypothetical protein